MDKLPYKIFIYTEFYGWELAGSVDNKKLADELIKTCPFSDCDWLAW